MGQVTLALSAEMILLDADRKAVFFSGLCINFRRTCYFRFLGSNASLPHISLKFISDILGQPDFIYEFYLSSFVS